jgi:hypothetical protein
MASEDDLALRTRQHAVFEQEGIVIGRPLSGLRGLAQRRGHRRQLVGGDQRARDDLVEEGNSGSSAFEYCERSPRTLASPT